MPNFIAHDRSQTKTEVDVFAVRLQHSCEAGFQDDNIQLGIPEKGIDVILAEAKTRSMDKLNDAWTKREKKALDYVLKRVGIVPVEEVERVADELYEKRKASRQGFTVRICAFAESISPELTRLGVTPVRWIEVLQFIHRRFHDNEPFKRDHKMWDDFGKYLWQNVESSPPADPQRFFDGWIQWQRGQTQSV
jgi:hypothetical protein